MIKNGEEGFSRLVLFTRKLGKCIINPFQVVIVEVRRRVEELCNWK